MSRLIWQTESRQVILTSLSEGLIKSTGGMGRSRHSLEIHHPAVSNFNHLQQPTGIQGFGLSLSFVLGSHPLPGQSLHCDTAKLPFQDRVFSRVVLHHAISQGREPELSEAVRVLDTDGVLIILGLNRLGWCYRFQGKGRELPGMAPLIIKHELDRLNMTMEGFAGAGLFGQSRPRFMSSGLAGLGSPLADVILLKARHNDGPTAVSLRFTEQRSSLVQSAPL